MDYINEYNNDNKKTKNSKLIISIQESERQRIARDLHDTSLQDLTHIIHQVELCGLYMQKDPLKANMELISIKQGIKSVIDEIRDIIFDLRPMSFDDLGLKETFEVYFQNLKKTTNYEFILDIQPIVSNDQSLLISIYRIVVECVHNAIEHSHGTQISFTCKTDGYYCYLWIKDNGKGYVKEEVSNKKNHYGLSVLNERIKMLDGDINVNTGIDKGTKIFISIPL